MLANLSDGCRPTARQWIVGALLAAFAGFPAGCQKSSNTTAASAANWFADITEKSRLNFVHDVGPVGNYFMPTNVGSGAALFDYDNDGRLDIYLIQNAGAGSGKTNRLFHQEPNGTFKDVSAGSGLDVDGRGMGVAIGDVNNDGLPDVLVTEYGRIRLFLNLGSGKFRDITKEAGLDDPLWSTSAAFVDYDRDGWLDLVVTNYVEYDPANGCVDESGKPDFCGPKAFPPGTATKLFHNLGRVTGGSAAVRFEDVTLPSGLGAHVGPGLGVVCLDFDGDGWPDILVTNDGKPNHLWMNQRNGTFKEEAVQRGIAYNAMGTAQANMGIAVGDVDGDGLFDIFVTHLTDETNILWKQGPRGLFQDFSAGSRLATPGWPGTGFGTMMADFDNDGALDVALVNGGVRRDRLRKPDAKTIATLGPFWAVYAERNQLFAGDRAGHFRDVSLDNEPFCGTARISRGLAIGDIDNDGGVDMLVTTVAGPALLYRNVTVLRGHWLSVRAIEPTLGGRDAYGAEITVVAGGRRWLRWVGTDGSYLCANDPRAHFGLGKAERLDEIRVRWLGGPVEIFPGGAADRFVVVKRGEGRTEK